MESKFSRSVQLETDIALLKKDEERYRYLVTSTKTSGEYRREASAKLQEVRKQICLIRDELNTLR